MPRRRQAIGNWVLWPCLAGLLSLAAAPARAQTDGSLSVPLRDASGNSGLVVEEVRLYRASHALVIGNDNYTNGWPRLSMAVNDARIIAEELKRQGFDVTLKTDLKSAELDQALREFFIVRGDDPEARLFLWYAGHGDTENGEGFLVPTDAPRADLGTKFTLAALPMRRFGEYVRLAKAKHVYAVFDSCFSGTIFEAERGFPPRAITRATALPVRQFLTSGDANQTVFDNGTFRELFLRALKGEEGADANGDGYMTGTEIGLFLTDRITNLTRSRQTPRYGKLLDKDLDRGDFVFRIDGATALAQAPPIAEPPPPTAGGQTRSSEALMVEMAFWDAIKNSTNPGDYKAYLEAYPQGRFAALARVRAAGAMPSLAMPSPATPPAAAPPAPALGPPPTQVATRSAPTPDPAAEAKAKAEADARAKAEAEAQRRAAEERARQQAEAEKLRQAAQEKTAQQAEAEKQRKAAEEKARQRAEADKQRQAEEAERQRKAEADARRRAAEARKTPAPPAVVAVAPPPPPAVAPPAPPPSTAFRPPAVGTRFHYDNGGTVTVESVDAQTLHLVNAQGRRFNFVSCCWDGDSLQLQGQYPFKELWPLKVGNRVQFTVTGFLASETWVHSLKVLRQERVRVPAGEFDTFVIELEKRGVAQNTHRSTQTYWFAPELGFPVRLEVSLLSGITGARSWQLARVERPGR